MPAPGRILRGSLSSVNGPTPSDRAEVAIVINGQVTMNVITKPSATFTNTELFIPINVTLDDCINFRTNSNTKNATNNIVSLLIELDL